MSEHTPGPWKVYISGDARPHEIGAPGWRICDVQERGTMKIWAKTDGEVREGKYLVVRRDGTIPDWPHFVLGGYDPCVPAALKEYAKTARLKGYDPEYCASIEELAYDFERLSATERARRIADPDAGPHRTDNPAVINMMRGEGDLTDYRENWFPGPMGHRDACALGQAFNAVDRLGVDQRWRINEWLKKLIASAADNPANATGSPDGR